MYRESRWGGGEKQARVFLLSFSFLVAFVIYACLDLHNLFNSNKSLGFLISTFFSVTCYLPYDICQYILKTYKLRLTSTTFWKVNIRLFRKRLHGMHSWFEWYYICMSWLRMRHLQLHNLLVFYLIYVYLVLLYRSKYAASVWKKFLWMRLLL